MNIKLRQKAQNNFEKNYLSLMNNAVFGETVENMRKNRDLKLVTTEKRRNYLVSESNYYTTKFITEKLFYLGLSILDLSKTVMYEFGCDYVKPKYGESEKLCYMDTCCFIVYVKTEDIYRDIAADVETIEAVVNRCSLK